MFHVNHVGLCIALAKGLAVLIVNGQLALAVDVDWVYFTLLYLFQVDST